MSPRLLSVGRITADFYTSPHATADLDPEPALVAAIDSAKRSILFAVYSFTSRTIADALARAAVRGVAVVGVVDAGQERSAYSMADWLAPQPGFSLRRSTGSGLMHDKVLVVDQGKRLALGSFNWTAAAERRNVEVLLIARSRPGSKLAVALTQQIQATWDRGAPLIA
jgi:phosphatidylserine/phosphatidylglycerophosphate/cardiolipin synthase-like enzyme